MQRLLFSVLLASLSFVESSYAEGVHTRIHHHYQSPRSLGMGDATVAATRDYSSIFYNPAALARRDDGNLNLSIDVAATSSFSTFIKNAKDASETQGTEQEKINAAINFLDGEVGKHFQLRAGLLEAALVRPNWGLAFIPADLTVEFKIHKQVGPAINARVYADTTLAYAYADEIKGIPGRLSWGTTAKFVNRGYVNEQINSINLAANSQIVRKEDLREGYTVDADLGLLYTPDLPGEGFWSLWRLAKPTLGAVVRNVGEIGFGQSLKLINKEKTAAPEKLYRVLDVGTKFEYPSFWIFGGRGTMDFRDIGHPNITPRKSFHVGFEFDWAVASWWKGQYRVGLNQGYMTAGVSLLFAVFNLDVATWAEDVGTLENPQESRQYMARLNLDF